MNKRCIQCKRTLPDESFLKIVSRAYRVRKCIECAHDNMRRWAKTNLSGFNAVSVKDAGD